MAKLFNLAAMSTATAGTGTITLGSAVSGYLTFAQAGVANGDIVDYAIKDGVNSEHGTGTYTSSGTTLTRTVTKSTNSDAAISLSGSAQVFISPRAQTLNDASLFTTGTVADARLPTSATAVKAWVNFGYVAGVPTINSSFNVASLTDNATGDFTINFSNALPNANYAIAGSAHASTATNSQGLVNLYATSAAGAGITKTTSACRMICGASGSGAPFDFANVSVMIIGSS